MIALLLALAACDASKPDGDVGTDSAADTATPDTGEDSGAVDSGVDPGDSAADSGETGTALVDADGDGHASVETGGDDCDDGDAWAYPGATEWCDLADQDCDGEPLAEGACAGVQELGPTAPLVAEGAGGSILEGMGTDGATMMQFKVTELEGPDGSWPRTGYAVYTVEPERWPLAPPDEASHAWVSDCILSWPEEAGDVDGDGIPDVVVRDSLCGYRVVVQRGPVPQDGASTWLSESDTWWSSDVVHSDGWAGGLAFGGDFDGDGRNDVVARMQTFDVASDDEFHVYYGGEFGDRFTRVLGPGGASDQVTLDDLDGDGLSDLLVVDEEIWILSGGDLRGADGAWVQDLAIASTEPYQGTNGELDQAWASVEDWTGDGLNDVAAIGRGADVLGYEHGAVYIFDGSTRGEFEAGDALGSWVGLEGGEIGGWIRKADMDGDGDDELAVWTYVSGTPGTVFLPGGTVPAPFTSIEEGALRMAAGMPARDGGDLNGDGYDDWLLYDGSYTESSYVLYGWDVPWGEEPWW